MAKPLVLVVDGDQQTIATLSSALRDGGYQVASALDGEAPGIAKRVQPRAIVLAVPPRDSESAIATRQLRADPRTAGIPIIALAEMPDRRQHPGLIADALLPKQCRLSELCAAVARWLKPT